MQNDGLSRYLQKVVGGDAPMEEFLVAYIGFFRRQALTSERFKVFNRKKDEFCDEFCIKNDEFCIINSILLGLLSRLLQSKAAEGDAR